MGLLGGIVKGSKGSVIGGALNLGASIYGGIKQAQAMRDITRNLNAQKAENEVWYQRNYNEDATQRADAQRMITATEESIKNRNRQAQATAAVMGQSNEDVAQQVGANNSAIADTNAQIASAGAARKDNIDSQYRQVKSGLNGQLNQVTQQKAELIAQSAQNAANAGAELAKTV